MKIINEANMYKQYGFRFVTKNMVKRAEKCGFKAIVLTVDTPFCGIRRADVRNKFALPSHLRLLFTYYTNHFFFQFDFIDCSLI